MAFTYRDIIPPIVENTVMKMKVNDGVDYVYSITAIDGYVLHDKRRDWTAINPDTLEETYMLGYASGTVTCPASYDFTANPWEFYAVPEDSVPADQIFGATPGNDHEVM